MKAKFWMAALAGVALASCVNEELVVDNQTKQPKELTFATPSMYKQSRANGEILGTEYPDDEMFVVYAVQHDGAFAGWQGDNVMKGDDGNATTFFPKEGVVVQKVGNYWHITGDTKYLWPENETKTSGDAAGDTESGDAASGETGGEQTGGGQTTTPTTDYRLSFAAHSPSRLMLDNEDAHAESVSYGPTGFQITGYKMPADPFKHFDLMYTTRTLNAVTSPVAINFKHALASVRFQFVKQSVDTGGAYKIHLKKLEVIGDISNKGNFAQNIENTGDLSGYPTWSGLELVKDTDGETFEYVLFNDVFTVPEGTASEIPVENVASFMPIPQTVNDRMKVRITYDVHMTVNDTDAAEKTLEIPFTDFLIPSSTDYTQNWARANRYIYTVQFGTLKEIFFAPVISEDWTTHATAGIYQIGNVQIPSTSDEGGSTEP